MTLRILAAAELEILEAANWYEDQRTNLGEAFLDEIARALDQIERDPRRCGRLEEFVGEADVRRCLLSRFPYLIVYRLQDDETLIVAVSHARRRPFYWLKRLD